MPRIRAVVMGAVLVTWLMVAEMWPAEFAGGAGLLTMLIWDVPHNARTRRRLRIEHERTGARLGDAQAAIGQMQGRIDLQSRELGRALAEIERRDAVGAPEARRLIQEQRATLAAQSKAMQEAQRLIREQRDTLARIEARAEEESNRWEDTTTTLIRMMQAQIAQSENAQARLIHDNGTLSTAFTESNREMQRAMTTILARLATEPRTSQVTVSDSVVMGDGVPLLQPVTLDMSPSRARRPPPLPNLDASKGRWGEALNEDLA